jgi:hypothetical protein
MSIFIMRTKPLLVALCCALVLIPFTTLLVHAQGGTDHLSSGEVLHVNSYLSSPNGMYELRMQPDGNLVIYRITSSVSPIWATGTSGQNNFLGNQGDGNLVLYTNDLHPSWASNTGSGPVTLVMQNDGNLVLYLSYGLFPGNVPVWASNTSSPKSPADCDALAPVFLGSVWNAPTPDYPYLDGQRPVAWLHAIGRVNSWSIACISKLQVTIQRKNCGFFGCGWVDRAISSSVIINQRGWTFVQVDSTCKDGSYTYRTEVDVTHYTIGDSGEITTDSFYSQEATWNCTGIGS